MFAGTTPVKTAEGQAELNTRARRISQRHRTVLFLVDGRRSEDEIVALAAKAGVFVHGQAGDLAARGGERGLLASDVLRQVRACVNPA